MLQERDYRPGSASVLGDTIGCKEGFVLIAMVHAPAVKWTVCRNKVPALTGTTRICEVLVPQLVDVLAPHSGWILSGRNHPQPNQNGFERTLSRQAIQMVGIRKALLLLQQSCISIRPLGCDTIVRGHEGLFITTVQARVSFLADQARLRHPSAGGVGWEGAWGTMYLVSAQKTCDSLRSHAPVFC